MNKLMNKHLKGHLFIFILGIILSSCAVESQPQLTPPQVEEETILPTPTPTLAPPVNMLSVCVGEEPNSLFLYGDVSPVARSLRQAIYDGPVDVLNFNPVPVILTQAPSQANGAVTLVPVEVQPGMEMVDLAGNLTYLTPGTRYRPAGCFTPECAQTYPGQGSVNVDQVVVRFELVENLRWSDGVPLTAEDSVYSYQVAKEIFTQFPPDTLRFTQAYWALDERKIEWRGIPGYQGIPAYTEYFFTPLPQHAWEDYTLNELLTTPDVTQKPLGWGPYLIDEWVTGDHISLRRNPYYFKASEDFPYFDHLSFRFVDGPEQALSAFLGGECDVVGHVDNLINELDTLQELEKAGELKIVFADGKAWEQAAFGISSLDPQAQNLFQEKKTRQAIARCIDRQALVAEVNQAGSVANAYLPQTHPLNEVGDVYTFAPQEATAILEEVGWADPDQDPDTPRLAAGVPGVEDGTPLAFTYSLEGDGLSGAEEIIREGLARCGVEVSFETQSAGELFAPGPEGPVFGRRFEMAQFAWRFRGRSLCKLFTSGEIPGLYPDYPKGWGGANAPGYSNPDFDAACNLALTSLPDSEATLQAHQEAVDIFVEDLPVLPLYFWREMMVLKPDIVGPESGAYPFFWNLEEYR
ncbi:MAG: putative ABC transporter-binding protein [Chloroflexi bacterium]|nr:putative ABC transporter-binding protein [Chloroflexota bacterium]